MNSCSTFSQLNCNIHDNKNDGSKGPWHQYGGRCSTIDKNFRARKPNHGGNSCILARWSWVKIKGNNNKCTIFISAYRYCKNTMGINTVCNQQVRFVQHEDRCQDSVILENFDTQLCYFIDNI